MTPLLRALAKLMKAENMTLPASAVPAVTRKKLASSEWADCIRNERRGAGQVLRVIRAPVVEQYLNEQWPAWNEDESQKTGPARAESIRAGKDSKSGARIKRWQLQTRSFPADTIESYILEDDKPHQVSLSETVYLVENLEVWLYAEVLADQLPAGDWIYYGGFVSKRITHLIQESRCEKLVLLPDYDPVGYANYVKMKQALSADTHVELYFPEVITKKFLRRYGNAKLWKKQQAYKRHLATLQATPGRLSKFIDMQVELGLALEQEALLIDRMK